MKQQLESQFEILNLRKLGKYWGVDFSLSTTNISMSQTTYTENMLKQFRLDTCNLIKTQIVMGIKLSSDMGENRWNSTLYREMVGKLIY